MEIGYSFDEICGILSKQLKLPERWVRAQIAMDDELINRSTGPTGGPTILPEHWVAEWSRRQGSKGGPRDPPTHQLTQLYYAYTHFLASIPGLCSTKK